ncbi:MAG: hemin uptake protein HemP [Nitrosospira sp.]
MLDQNKRLYTEALFVHGDEVLIQHQGEQYRLRRTRNGKLILTK